MDKPKGKARPPARWAGKGQRGSIEPMAGGFSRYYYALDAKWNPFPVANVIAWARAFEPGSRVLKRTSIGRGVISTVFLGLDINLGMGKKPPILWETMVFDVPGMDRYQARYSTKEQALAGHDAFRIEAIKIWNDTHKRPAKVIDENLIIYSRRKPPPPPPMKGKQ